MKTFLFISIVLAGFNNLNPQIGQFQNKKWRVIKEVVTTEDKKGAITQKKDKDFTLFDYLDFDSSSKMTMTSYGTSMAYAYTLKDNVLTFWPEKNKEKRTEFRVMNSTKDSLVWKRTEIWGGDAALKITLALHMVPYSSK